MHGFMKLKNDQIESKTLHLLQNIEHVPDASFWNDIWKQTKRFQIIKTNT